MVKKVLFVCLGNICRSPIAEAVFRQLVEDRNISDEWDIDSAAIGGWHEGNPPDSRALEVLKNHNISYHGRARQIEEDDFNTFDFMFGMDENNISSLKGDTPKGCRAKILLLGDFDPQGERIIRDPFYDTGSQGFEKCYQQCLRSCTAFLDQQQ